MTGLKTLVALLLMTSAAVAQQTVVPRQPGWQSMSPDNMPVGGLVTAPPTPTQQQKVEAFRKAYERRDKDVSEEVKADILQKVYKSFSGADDARPVKTEKIIPVVKEEDLNDIDRAANLDRLQRKWVDLRRREFVDDNVCTRHHMHKVTFGNRWRCRK